jgi:MtN3 and saliva related transmembrane protein
LTFGICVGYVAAIVSTISFVPQAWKIIRSRKTTDISAGTYALTVLGFGLWVTFGIIQRQWPVVASNIVCFFIAAFILAMKLLPKRLKDSVANTVSRKSPS